MPPDPNGNEPDSSQGKGEPEFVNNEQLNSAIAGKIRALEARFDKRLKESLAAAGETIVASVLEQLGNQEPPEGGAGGDGGEPKPGSDDLAKLTRKYDRKLADLTKRAELAEQQRETERKNALDVRLRKLAQDELSGAGIQSESVRHALGFLVDAEKRVFFDDDGKASFRDEDDLVVPLRDGIASWAKSDGAKIYLPPRGASGSGDRNHGKPPSPKQDASSERRSSIMGAFGVG